MSPQSDLAAALQVVGVLLIPLVLLLESWLPDALDCAVADVPTKGDGAAARRDQIRGVAAAQAPRMLGLSLLCLVLAALMTREVFGLQYVGFRYEVIPTAWTLMTVGLWASAGALFLLSIRLFGRKRKAA